MSEPSEPVPQDTECGTFGCDRAAVVRTTRAHEWFPGWYCAEHGQDGVEVRGE